MIIAPIHGEPRYWKVYRISSGICASICVINITLTIAVGHVDTCPKLPADINGSMCVHPNHWQHVSWNKAACTICFNNVDNSLLELKYGIYRVPTKVRSPPVKSWTAAAIVMKVGSRYSINWLCATRWCHLVENGGVSVPISKMVSVRGKKVNYKIIK